MLLHACLRQLVLSTDDQRGRDENGHGREADVPDGGLGEGYGQVHEGFHPVLERGHSVRLVSAIITASIQYCERAAVLGSWEVDVRAVMGEREAGGVAEDEDEDEGSDLDMPDARREDSAIVDGARRGPEEAAAVAERVRQKVTHRLAWWDNSPTWCAMTYARAIGPATGPTSATPSGGPLAAQDVQARGGSDRDHHPHRERQLDGVLGAESPTHPPRLDVGASAARPLVRRTREPEAAMARW